LNPFEVSGITTAAFWAIAALTIGAAALVVTVRNIFRAAIFLALSFAGIAGLYFLLSAEFIGVVQVLVYVGAVSILIVFAIMLVRDVSAGSRSVNRPEIAALVAGLVAAALIFVAYRTGWQRIEDLDNPGARAGLAGTYVEVQTRTGVAIVAPAGPEDQGAQSGVLADSTGTVGTLLVRDYLLAFETIGVVLTAALIGALALLRDRRAA
jgi:NADH-quinone oxidoreductase subunit J